MNEEINKIINWIEMSYTRLNYKEELLLVNYIKQLQQENARLKDKFKDLEEWLEAMVRIYENEYKDVDTSENYKCMLHKLKEN